MLRKRWAQMRSHLPGLTRWLVPMAMSVLVCTAGARAGDPCRIDIVEAGSGWPVPLVELRTTHNLTFVSDNAGVIAFDAPELMGRETWFFIEGHGYGVPKDGFGYRGVRLTPQPGGRLTVKVQRELPAKRLGRITGAGLFAESQKLGLEPDWQEQGILGCDTVQTTVHQGRLHWAWGDTTLAHYPLGIFNSLGATTDVQPLSSFAPPVRLRYDYVTDAKGTPRAIAKMPGEGPTWISGHVSLPDRNGTYHLGAVYAKIKGFLTPYEYGLCVWDEAEQRFDRHRVLWTRTDDTSKPPVTPEGHAVFWTHENGKKWVLFGDPFPRIQCEPTFEAWSDPAAWQVLTPQAAVPAADGKEEIKPHRGSIAYNAYRRRWVTVFTQSHGKPSFLGEIWYAEAASPLGPWQDAVKVVTHHNHTFYNPMLHPEFTAPDSPILLFEGTYTREFADHAVPTPRYDYNQILYRLDLHDPALKGPQR